jgi:hypothetical protein
MSIKTLFKEAFELIISPFGKVYPPKPSPPFPSLDIRTIALRRFAEFLSAIRFQRVGDTPGSKIEFQVPIENIFIEQPDDVKELKFPAISFLPGRGTSEALGLGPPIPLDETWNVYGKNTVLLLQGEYMESFTIEVWGSKKAERRALIAGISSALRLSELTYPIRLELPNYYGRVAEFILEGNEHIDDSDIVRGRRRGHIFVTMRLPEVQLINTAQALVPILNSHVREVNSKN